MNYKESRYEFKKLLLNVHEKNVRDYTILKGDNEFELIDQTTIILPSRYDDVILNGVRDFEDFLFTSMGVSVCVLKNDVNCNNKIKIILNKDIGDASGYMGYRITINANDVLIEGYDSRGIAQALYFLEDLMNIKKAPILKSQTIARKAIFERRISQSPFGMFEWPDTAFLHLAHNGMDTINLWLKDIDKNQHGGYIDIATLAERASRFGIDVFVTLYTLHNCHPSEPNAESFYDNIYGKLLKTCPNIKGIFLLGEATEFTSHDPNAGLAPRQKNYVDNIPTGKCTPGWWPYYDYAEWVELIKKVARKYNPNIEVFLSTYNWGYAPKEDRISLINRLPTDVGINVTWDMFEQFTMGSSCQDVVDYSLNTVGPGKYFESEAIVAKERGVKLMANAQTSGRTWDFGPIPYEPMPYQWLKRYEGLVEASKKWDLKIIYENIHYAFQPSIISKLEKFTFFTEYEFTPKKWLELLIESEYGAKSVEKVTTAFELFSQAITYYPATNEDQYGTWRTGPSYPFWLVDPRIGLNPIPEEGRPPITKFDAKRWYFGWYTPDIAGRNSLPGVRIFDEISLITKMRELFIKGYELLNEIDNENVNLLKLKALLKFMINSSTTTINFKNLYIKMQRLSVIGDKEKANEILNEVEELLICERKNAEDTISAVQVDSRLGWEAQQDYVCNEDALRWKMRQIDHELKFTLKKFRDSNSL